MQIQNNIISGIKNIMVSLVGLLFLSAQGSAQNAYYFPAGVQFDPKVPTPEQFFGYPIGSHYTRHDEIVAYFRELARVSDRVHVQSIGKTYEEREQVIATFTAPANFERLEAIRQEHQTLVDPSKPLPSGKAPVVVLLGYSVHGNETSSGEVSLLQAYYLAAGQDEETRKWLQDAVIFIDPSLNPDGRDRAANWYNSYKSFPPVADPLDKEHQEGWPGGRSNHYLNNLNRDWLNLTQVESVNRIAFFHQWYPNVQIDFHEQGPNATYYFEPTPRRHESPIIPRFLYDFSAVLAKYQAKALDDIGSLYFTKENYDNLSPIYGSTYPKFFGSVAATFEEASSGGIVKETVNGLLTFPFTIRNHLATSLATIRGAVAEREGLLKEQKQFFQYALEQGQKNPTKAYVFGDSGDENLTRRFLDLLLKHRVQVYELGEDFSQEGKRFEKGKAFIVPSAQPNFLIVHSLFEENLLTDSIYYDNTGWSVIHAYGLQYAKLTGAGPSRGERVSAVEWPKGEVAGGKADYAYLLSWTDYNASKALYQLLSRDVRVRTAFKPFTAGTLSGKKSYGYGSLVIPVAGQSLSGDSLYRLLQETAGRAHVRFDGVRTGWSAEGIDLGSSNIRSVRKPEVAVAFGQGVNYEEAGQVWYLLNQQLGLPVVKLDLLNFQRASLKKYSTLVLPGGNYSSLDKQVVEKIKSWVEEGGVLITFQNASAWAVRQEIVKEKLIETEEPGRAPGGQVAGGAGGGVSVGGVGGGAGDTRAGGAGAKAGPGGAGVGGAGVVGAGASGAGAGAGGRGGADGKTAGVNERLDYIRKEDVEGARRINGAIFEADIDVSHPVGFGLASRKLYINKNGATFLARSTDKYATIAEYTTAPFVNGYTSKENINKVRNSAAIIADGVGSGAVILFADDPTYRNYWLGTNRLFLNALFFGNLLGGGLGFGGEE